MYEVFFYTEWNFRDLKYLEKFIIVIKKYQQEWNLFHIIIEK